MQIDTFFIGIAQRYDYFDLCDLKCKIIIVCHDVGGASLQYFNIPQSGLLYNFVNKHLIGEVRLFNEKMLAKKKKSRLKFIAKLLLYPLVLLRRYFIKRRKSMPYRSNFQRLFQQANVFVITDSEYSKYGIQYFLGNPKNKIEVLWVPLCNEYIEAKNMNKISINEKYFLLISVDRVYKNAVLFLEQWEKFCLATNYEYHCVLVGEIEVNIKNCIVLKRVSSEELAYLYKNAFAFVYPSFTEGFGLPPIEAASHGTPSICSNATAIPEICGDMPIYFSPFYPEDLFRAMIKMTESREFYVEKTKKRFLEINQRQKEDLQKLIDFILGEVQQKGVDYENLA